MNQTPFNHPALLPAGLHDVLPPEAELEARSVETIMDCFAAHGYQLVKPPIVEFEDSLFSGSGAAVADQTFRFMDPDSQRMMGLRADTTPQIARLAATRLNAAPRPLRLAYAGQCLRVRGSHLAPERQIAQAGIELIGPDTAEADAEIILTSAEALAAVGLPNVSFDLTVPRLVLHLLETANLAEHAALTRALERKDNAGVTRFGGAIAAVLLDLLQACGPADDVLPKLLAIQLPDVAKAQAIRMAETCAAVRAYKKDLHLTLDPVEFRNYQYHTGICMTVFAPGSPSELGRGGRYLCSDLEPATGITLYPDTIVRVAPPPRLRKRLYLPFGTAREQAAVCRAQGFATIAALAADDEPRAEAVRLGCTHIFQDGDIIPLSKDGV
jgi:ATP phosphoribosyltransferase regulatory subunit